MACSIPTARFVTTICAKLAERTFTARSAIKTHQTLAVPHSAKTSTTRATLVFCAAELSTLVSKTSGLARIARVTNKRVVVVARSVLIAVAQTMAGGFRMTLQRTVFP